MYPPLLPLISPQTAHRGVYTVEWKAEQFISFLKTKEVLSNEKWGTPARLQRLLIQLAERLTAGREDDWLGWLKAWLLAEDDWPGWMIERLTWLTERIIEMAGWENDWPSWLRGWLDMAGWKDDWPGWLRQRLTWPANSLIGNVKGCWWYNSCGWLLVES